MKSDFNFNFKVRLKIKKKTLYVDNFKISQILETKLLSFIFVV